MKIALNDIQRKYPDVKIEMTQNYATLSDTEKQYFDGRNYGKGMNGYYNDKTDTVVIFADNIQNTDHLEKTFAHETAGHKGLQVLLGNEYTSIIDEIYSAVNQKHGAELQELAATYGQDLNTAEGQRYVIEEYLANQADLKQLSGFKSFVQKIKLALRKVGFRAKWTDDEIATLMRRSLENVRKQRYPRTGNNNGAWFNIGNDNSIDPEVRQAFPKYRSSQAKEVLKSISGKDLKNLDTGIEAQINTNQYNKLISNAAAQKSENNGFSRDEHFEALANIEELYQNAILLKKTDDLKNNDPNVKIYRFASPFVIDNEIADVLLTVKESIDNNSKKIYSLELTEIKKLSVKGGTLEYHTDSIDKLQQKHEKVKQFLEKNQENIRKSISPVWTGSAADYDKPSLLAVGIDS